jgi:inorganic pyrophosphatase
MKIPARAASGLVHVLVDTPKGSAQKYKYDSDSGLFKLSRILPLGMSFPCDFGSIPGTAAPDGDALDVALLGEHPSFTGCLMTVRLLGMLEAEQVERGRAIRNDRLVGIAHTPVNRPRIRDLADVPADVLGELEHFFKSYNSAQGREFRILSRRGRAAADRSLGIAVRLHERQCNGGATRGSGTSRP